MKTYRVHRGLDAVKVLAKTFSHRLWYVPDFICDEVLDVIIENVPKIKFYNVSEDFKYGTVDMRQPCIFYSIDYFGKESLQWTNPNVIMIRDSVWFPDPWSPVLPSQIWFNSQRKIIYGSHGAKIISYHDLPVRNSFFNDILLPMSWNEVETRWVNWRTVNSVLADYRVRYMPEFPTLYPILLPNRDEVLAKLGTPLPGHWKNKHNLDHPFYKTITYIPIDSRFDEEYLLDLSKRIKSYVIE
jgi:hypothetical protein